jgi:TonB family protein
MSRLISALLVSVSFCVAQDRSLSPERLLPDIDAREKILTDRLQQEPGNVPVLLQLAGLKQDHRQLDDAQSLFERALAIEPNNTAALESLGAIGWTRVFTDLRTARTQLFMEPETPGPLRDRATRAILNAKYAGTIADSIAYFERILAVDPQNNSAMGYLNVVYRAKADLEDTPEAYHQDLAVADTWVRKAFEAAKAKPVAERAAVPPPPPADPAASTHAQRIRVGSVQSARLIRKIEPIYPEEARSAHIQGTVRFDAVIAQDGTVAHLTVVSGHPLLVPAALDAVRQWVYQPTLLNSQPVEVATAIEVDFTLPN